MWGRHRRTTGDPPGTVPVEVLRGVDPADGRATVEPGDELIDGGCLVALGLELCGCVGQRPVVVDQPHDPAEEAHRVTVPIARVGPVSCERTLSGSSMNLFHAAAWTNCLDERYEPTGQQSGR
jgi:hypothetical protein